MARSVTLGVLGLLTLLPVIFGGGKVARSLTFDDVAFAIGSGAPVFCSRWEEFTATWWRPDLHGIVLLDELTPDAQKCHAKLSETFPGLKIADAPPPPEFGEWNRGGERIIWSQIHLLRQHFPDKKWYVLPDDDTMFLLDNLLDVLADFDPSTPVHLGGCPNERRVYAHWARHGKPMSGDGQQLYGGAGLVVSAALMAQLEPSFDECLLNLRELWGGDDRLQSCVRSMDLPTTVHPGFHQLDSGLGPMTDLFEAHPPVPVVSLHHFDTEHLQMYLKSYALNTSKLQQAMMADQGAFLQQTVCAFERMGSFSIANGFSVRWWDDVINTAELLSYTPYLAYVPKERYLFTNVHSGHHSRGSQHLVYEYMHLYKALPPGTAHAGANRGFDWKGVRVTMPAGMHWAHGSLCCDAAYETADDPDIAELVLVEC